jgi:hypothetical protein
VLVEILQNQLLKIIHELQPELLVGHAGKNRYKMK